MIINSGVNVDIVDKTVGKTPLHYAAANGRPNIDEQNNA